MPETWRGTFCQAILCRVHSHFLEARKDHMWWIIKRIIKHIVKGETSDLRSLESPKKENEAKTRRGKWWRVQKDRKNMRKRKAVQRKGKFVARAVFGDFGLWFWRQVQYLVILECQLSWQAQCLFDDQVPFLEEVSHEMGFWRGRNAVFFHTQCIFEA